MSYGKSTRMFWKRSWKTIQWYIECYPTILGSKCAYGSHLHRWIHIHFQIRNRCKISFNIIDCKFSRIRSRSLIAPCYISKWSIITFINVLTHKRDYLLNITIYIIILWFSPELHDTTSQHQPLLINPAIFIA